LINPDIPEVETLKNRFVWIVIIWWILFICICQVLICYVAIWVSNVVHGIENVSTIWCLLFLLVMLY
jgi:hypothetical protein